MQGERIKEERVRLKLTQPEVAQICSAGKTTVISWEKSLTSPSSVQLSELYKNGFDILYIVTGKRFEVQKNELIDEEFSVMSGYDVHVSAGNGADIWDEAPSYEIAVKTKWLREHGYKANELVVVRAKGDSMEPTISDKAELIVNRGQKEPIDGKIFVIRSWMSLFVKRLQLQLDGSILLISDNGFYPPMVLNQNDNIEIIGQVVRVTTDI